MEQQGMMIVIIGNVNNCDDDDCIDGGGGGDDDDDDDDDDASIHWSKPQIFKMARCILSFHMQNINSTLRFTFLTVL